MRTVLLAATLASLSAPHLASADPTATPDVKTMVENDCARARKAGKTCVLDMKGEDIDGGKPGAGDISLTLAGFGKAASLIHIRRDFIPEILRTAEDLD